MTHSAFAVPEPRISTVGTSGKVSLRLSRPGSGWLQRFAVLSSGGSWVNPCVARFTKSQECGCKINPAENAGLYRTNTGGIQSAFAKDI